MANAASVLVLIAFTVAALSLLLQGGTVGPLVRRLTPKALVAAGGGQEDAERARLIEIMRSSADSVGPLRRPEGEPTPEDLRESQAHLLAVLEVQRAALLDARDNGTFDADVLADALANLDASQIAIELRGGPR
jgi:NhaP-type Na+/H+ or K+/H+ antiporter